MGCSSGRFGVLQAALESAHEAQAALNDIDAVRSAYLAVTDIDVQVAGQAGRTGAVRACPCGRAFRSPSVRTYDGQD